VAEWDVADVVSERRGAYQIGVQAEHLGCDYGNRDHFLDVIFAFPGECILWEREDLRFVFHRPECFARKQFCLITYEQVFDAQRILIRFVPPPA
jgi:hypothetical protein